VELYILQTRGHFWERPRYNSNQINKGHQARKEFAMLSDHDKFLLPAPGVQSDHPEIVALAHEIVSGLDDPADQARTLFDYVRDTVRYSVSVPFEDLSDYLALNILERGWGFCVQKGSLLCALARAAGIPTRLGFADIKNYLMPDYLDKMIPERILYYHCFVEWLLSGRWIKSTPSFDKQLTEDRGWRLVMFSPDSDALLPATDQAGRTHVEYVRYRGWRLGVPLDEFIEVNTANCGQEAMDDWRKLVRQAKPGSKSPA
jgi:transglutaminase-like putative cysteine protease